MKQVVPCCRLIPAASTSYKRKATSSASQDGYHRRRIPRVLRPYMPIILESRCYSVLVLAGTLTIQKLSFGLFTETLKFSARFVKEQTYTIYVKRRYLGLVSTTLKLFNTVSVYGQGQGCWRNVRLGQGHRWTSSGTSHRSMCQRAEIPDNQIIISLPFLDWGV